MKSIDWLSIRDVMLECLWVTFRWASWAEESQQVDCDNYRAAEHLAAIVKARDTLGRAMRVLNANDVSKLGPELQPSDPCAISNSMERLTVFDLLAQASARAGARPDFGIFATAHETAFMQLTAFILRLGFEIRNAIERAGISDNSIEDIEDLHRCSPEELRDALFELEKGMFMQSFLDRSVGPGILRPWIIREWADVSAIPPQVRSKANTAHGVEAESNTEIARYQQTISGDATPTIKPETSSEISSDGTNGNEAANAYEEEVRRALGTYQIRIKIAATLTPEQRRNIILAYWGLTPAKARDKWKIMGWSPSLGTEGKTKVAGKVKTYITRGKEKLAELAGKK